MFLWNHVEHFLVCRISPRGPQSPKAGGSQSTSRGTCFIVSSDFNQLGDALKTFGKHVFVESSKNISWYVEFHPEASKAPVASKTCSQALVSLFLVISINLEILCNSLKFFEYF